MASDPIQSETPEQTITRLEKRNRKLEKIYAEYKQVCRNEEERVKELNCLYQAARCVVVETDMVRALQKIACIIPAGWQFPDNTCARIFVNNQQYLSEPFAESYISQSEEIVLDNRPVGKIQVFYTPSRDSAKPGNPFLIEEKNLLQGIANIISFYLKKKKDDDNRELIQKQLLHADRLATIGQLAAGVAHELNEPLGNILGLAQLSLKLPGLPNQASADLGKIEDCVIYAREIIKKLMEFSRQSSLRKERFELNAQIDNSIVFLQGRCDKEGISVVREYDGPVMIKADPTQIKQVVTNLVLNAIQAMKDGGILTIATVKKDGKVIFSISDTGAGISKKDITNVFVPFFTTKDVGEGTGLGLSVVYGIVQSHNGDIKVKSRPGEGSAFIVTLPAEISS